MRDTGSEDCPSLVDGFQDSVSNVHLLSLITDEWCDMVPVCA